MILNPEQKSQVEAWFKEKGVRETCPACGARDWILKRSIDFMVLREDLSEKTHATSLHEIAMHMPSVLRLCTNCAYMSLFSATSMDIMDIDFKDLLKS